MSHTENLAPGNRGFRGTRLNNSRAHNPKHIRLSPTAEQELLFVMGPSILGRSDRLYLSSTNDQDLENLDRLQRIDLSFCYNNDQAPPSSNKCNITDIEWLPDGSGFMVSMHMDIWNSTDKVTQHFDRLYRHDLVTGNSDMLVSLEDEYVGNFTISPTADKVAYEAGTRNDGPYDIWIYDIVNDSSYLLVEDGAAPAWSH